MVLLAVALAALLWERLENIPFSLRAIPIGVLVLSILFAVYAYGRRREVSELKGLLRGLQDTWEQRLRKSNSTNSARSSCARSATSRS